jgi:hypothetical protein
VLVSRNVKGEGFVDKGRHLRRLVETSMTQLMPGTPVRLMLNPVGPRLVPVRVIGGAATTVIANGMLVCEPTEIGKVPSSRIPTSAHLTLPFVVPQYALRCKLRFAQNHGLSAYARRKRRHVAALQNASRILGV